MPSNTPLINQRHLASQIKRLNVSHFSLPLPNLIKLFPFSSAVPPCLIFYHFFDPPQPPGVPPTDPCCIQTYPHCPEQIKPAKISGLKPRRRNLRSALPNGTRFGMLPTEEELMYELQWSFGGFLLWVSKCECMYVFDWGIKLRLLDPFSNSDQVGEIGNVSNKAISHPTSFNGANWELWENELEE